MEKENTLIAEFMGRVKTFDIIDDNTYQGEITLTQSLTQESVEGEIGHFEDRYNITPIAKETPLKYHTEWNWLMPVVRKIVDICCNDDDDNLFLSDEYTSILDTVSCAVIQDSYKVVVEFIKFYNLVGYRKTK